MRSFPKLTPRQRAFLDNLLELYQEHRGPVHYSDVAVRLGVNRVSAYDMLKVLEQKGFASSSYSLAAGHSGPGRSMVVFAPTAQASVLAYSTPAAGRLDEDWQGVRERILSRLQQARETSYREALNDLLARLPEGQASLAFSAQMVGILLLNLRRVTAKAEGLNPFGALDAFRATDDAGLGTLAGLSVGASLAADEEAGLSYTQRLLDLARHYQVNLGRLSEEARSALIQFLEDALEALD